MNKKLDDLLKSTDQLSKISSMADKFKYPTSAIDALLNTNRLMQSAMAPRNAIDQILLQKIPTYNNVISLEAQKQDLIRQIVFGGSTINSITKFHAIDEQTTKIQKAIPKWNDISKMLSNDMATYSAQVSLTKDLSSIFGSGGLGVNSRFKQNIFQSKIELQKPNYFDLLSGSAFANITKVYNDSKVGVLLREELKEIQDEVHSNPQITSETSTFAKEVLTTNEVEEYSTLLDGFINKLVSAFGWTKQKAYYFVILFFIAIDVGEDFGVEYIMQGDNKTYYNTYMINPKKLPVDVIIRNAPVYPKNLTSTRKIGMLKEYEIVEILRVKDGWCLVKGEAEIISKQKGVKTKKDSVLQGWIQQKYLKNYKD